MARLRRVQAPGEGARSGRMRTDVRNGCLEGSAELKKTKHWGRLRGAGEGARGGCSGTKVSLMQMRHRPPSSAARSDPRSAGTVTPDYRSRALRVSRGRGSDGAN
ncbi:hypothetical protein AAFF_G00421450 [Aldrovandia affinis]|uniref:Uncharacterized protein n=1 Tax=Aldrovandia affinis TaxID=143900 RepID=A0AAD7SA99_9TELE|nr:hypothetical protein AAFF_G00421450 [Aldrovandia affinis]